jgi:pterin-4a-carbinolamine dehydratase
MNEGVFISYRRDDAAAEAKLIAEACSNVLGDDAVFLDSSSVQAGSTWPRRIQDALRSSQYVLVVIGPDWLRAASDQWGRRRIDDPSDWVRQEIATALEDGNKILIPVLIRGGDIPPKDVLPPDIANISSRQSIQIRRDYWDHDIKLLTAQIETKQSSTAQLKQPHSPYPTNVPIGPDPLDEKKIELILAGDLKGWKKAISPLPEDTSKVRVELFREYRFKSFQEAIHFMVQVAPGCDIAQHHPRWENLWKSLRVYLSTWDIDHRISDRDIQLARYFDRAYSDFTVAPQKNQRSRK